MSFIIYLRVIFNSKSGCLASIPCIDSYIDFLNRSIDSNSTFEFAVPGNEPNLIKLESTIYIQ